jgi:hypothetical protein
MWGGRFQKPWRYRACRKTGGSPTGCSRLAHVHRNAAKTASCSIQKCYSNKIALPPNHAAFAGRVKIVERQFKVQRQDITVLQPNSCASVRNIVNCASEYAAPRLEVEQRALRDRRSTNKSPFDHHS